MKIGLVGLPMVGKTTFFNLLTNAEIETSKFLSGKTASNMGMMKVPDERIDFLAAMYKPRKTTYAQVECIDVPGLVPGSTAGNQFLPAIQNVDALVHIVRAFANDGVLHVEGSIDPMRDINTVNAELLLADLSMLENRIKRIESGKKITKENQQHLAVLRKCLAALEEEKPIHDLDLREEEQTILREYNFFTEKPLFLVINLDEDQLRTGEYPQKAAVHAYAAERGIPVIEVCALIEMEINKLDEDDRALFLAELGITEPGIDRLAKAAYDYFGLISFLTAGEDEVRAWTIKRGTDAKRAAGKIHSDIERGFIRAEVVKFADLKELGSMAKVKEKGLFRLEGKDYIVQDGDIINFRFNV